MLKEFFYLQVNVKQHFLPNFINFEWVGCCRSIPWNFEWDCVAQTLEIQHYFQIINILIPNVKIQIIISCPCIYYTMYIAIAGKSC